MKSIRRFTRQVSPKESVTIIRTNGFKGKVHVFVSPTNIVNKNVFVKRDGQAMPEYRKNPRTKALFPKTGRVVAKKSRRPVYLAEQTNLPTRREQTARSVRNKPTAKLELQQGFHYTEKRVIKELDDVLKSETYVHRSRTTHSVPYGSTRPHKNVAQPSIRKSPQRDQIFLEQGRRMTEGTTVSAPSEILTDSPRRLHQYHENRRQSGGALPHTERLILSVPECVQSLKRHYHRVLPDNYSDSSWEEGGEEGASVEVGTESELDEVQEQLKFKMDYWNKSIRRELPLPYLRIQDRRAGGPLNRRRSSLKNTVSKMTAFVTKKKTFGEIPDADGTPISPGDCVWISKPYLSIAIYVGKRSIVRCLATEIVKELVDPFHTIWKAKFTGGDAFILPKEQVLAAAKRRIGEIFVGTNMEFILNCLTNLESLEAYEAGFRLLDEKGTETNFHMTELF